MDQVAAAEAQLGPRGRDEVRHARGRRFAKRPTCVATRVRGWAGLRRALRAVGEAAAGPPRTASVGRITYAASPMQVRASNRRLGPSSAPHSRTASAYVPACFPSTPRPSVISWRLAKSQPGRSESRRLSSVSDTKTNCWDSTNRIVLLHCTHESAQSAVVSFVRRDGRRDYAFLSVVLAHPRGAS